MINKKLWLNFILIFTVFIVACDKSSPSTDKTQQKSNEPDTSTTQTSDKGLFRASFRSELDPLQLNQLHSWVIHIETVNGDIVENAKITVSGGMPDHNHGFPTAPRVTEYLNNGDYRMQGVKFSMPGWWEMRLTVVAKGQSDQLTFNLILP